MQAHGKTKRKNQLSQSEIIQLAEHVSKLQAEVHQIKQTAPGQRMDDKNI